MEQKTGSNADRDIQKDRQRWKENFSTEHIFNNLRYISHNLKLSQNWHAENPM